MRVDLYDILKFVTPERADFITHSGKFHADEATSTAILLLIRHKLMTTKVESVPHPALEHLRDGKEMKIARVDNRTLSEAKISDDALVYDIGGGEFDHHQLGRNGMRKNGIYYSSVGLIWREFGKMLCSNERVWQRVDDEILLTLRDGVVKVSVRQIYYVEVQNRMLIYHTMNGDYTMRGTMKSVEEQLAKYHFVKCNHWYIVNLSHVERISKDTVTVAGTELEISRRSRTSFLNALTDFMGGAR